MRKTIRELRLAYGSSQAHLAAQLNVTQSTVSRWELGVSAPSYEHLRELGRVFKVPLRSIALAKGNVEEIVPGVVIYCRTEPGADEDESDALKMQENSCRTYVAQRQYHLVDVVRETTPASQPLWDRPQLQSLRARVVAEAIEVIVCDNLEVLASDALELGLVYDEACNNNVQIETPSDGALATSKTGLDRFIAEHAQLIYSLRKSHASKRGRRNRVRAGKPLASNMPLYGYRWRDEEKSGLVIDPKTRPIVERIFEEAELGLPLRKIAAGLTADGIRTPLASPGHGSLELSIRSFTIPLTWVRRMGGLRHIRRRGVLRAAFTAFVFRPPLCQPLSMRVGGKRYRGNCATTGAKSIGFGGLGSRYEQPLGSSRRSVYS